MARTYHVYIMASNSRRLYIGVTGHLARRILQHRAGELEGFSKKYQMTGPVVVCMFGLVVLASYVLRRLLTRGDSGLGLRPARHG